MARPSYQGATGRCDDRSRSEGWTLHNRSRLPSEQPRRFEPRHLTGLLALWSRRWGGAFPLDIALWQQNTQGDPRHFRAERCWVVEDDGAVVGALALKAPDAPTAWVGQDPRRAWISFLVVEPTREAEIAPVLIDRALAWLRSGGFQRVSYGGDPSHFFPGVPDDDRALSRVLQTAGFQPGEIVHDLLGDLRRYHVPEGVEAALAAAQAVVRPSERGDVRGLLEFLDREFPGRWAYETRHRLQIEPTPADILVLARGADVIGFCHVYHSGSRRIGPSIYWRAAMGDHYGGLGPIGVGRSYRDRGLGRSLLGRALEHLRRLGVGPAVIDWTTLVDFYGRMGFQIWRTYRSWGMDL